MTPFRPVVRTLLCNNFKEVQLPLNCIFFAIQLNHRTCDTKKLTARAVVPSTATISNQR